MGEGGACVGAILVGRAAGHGCIVHVRRDRALSDTRIHNGLPIQPKRGGRGAVGLAGAGARGMCLTAAEPLLDCWHCTAYLFGLHAAGTGP